MFTAAFPGTFHGRENMEEVGIVPVLCRGSPIGEPVVGFIGGIHTVHPRLVGEWEDS